MKNNLHFLRDALFVTIGVVVILTAISIVGTSSIFSNSRLASGNQSEVLKKKNEIIALVASGNVLSLEQKEKIGREIIDGRASIFGFSEEELKVIVGAINK